MTWIIVCWPLMSISIRYITISHQKPWQTENTRMTNLKYWKKNNAISVSSISCKISFRNEDETNFIFGAIFSFCLLLFKHYTHFSCLDTLLKPHIFYWIYWCGIGSQNPTAFKCANQQKIICTFHCVLTSSSKVSFHPNSPHICPLHLPPIPLSLWLS